MKIQVLEWVGAEVNKSPIFKGDMASIPRVDECVWLRRKGKEETYKVIGILHDLDNQEVYMTVRKKEDLGLGLDSSLQDLFGSIFGDVFKGK